jgi:hypothetical protein
MRPRAKQPTRPSICGVTGRCRSSPVPWSTIHGLGNGLIFSLLTCSMRTWRGTDAESVLQTVVVVKGSRRKSPSLRYLTAVLHCCTATPPAAPGPKAVGARRAPTAKTTIDTSPTGACRSAQLAGLIGCCSMSASLATMTPRSSLAPARAWLRGVARTIASCVCA